MPIEMELIEGSQLREQGGRLSLTRVAKVTGVSGSPAARLQTALNAPGLPVDGEPHPEVPGLYVTRRTAHGEGPAVVHVVLDYASDPPDRPTPARGPRLTLGAGVQQRQTASDIHGQPLTVSYTANGVTDTVAHTCDVLRPTLTLTVSRVEWDSPEEAAAEHVGKVNAATWRGYPPRTWLCTAIQGDASDGGRSFTVHYQFEYDRATWDRALVYVPTGSHHPPRDITEDNGRSEAYALYEASDFNVLGL